MVTHDHAAAYATPERHLEKGVLLDVAGGQTSDRQQSLLICHSPASWVMLKVRFNFFSL